MAKSDQPHGKSGEAHAHRDEAHARRDERQASKVFDFAGDDTHPAGQVNIVAKGERGTVTVQPVGGGDQFTVKRDLLTEVGGEDGEDAAEGSAV